VKERKTKMDDAEDALVARLAALDSCTVSDALDKLAMPGSTLGLRPLWPGPRIVGRAVTVRLIAAGPGMKSRQHLGTAAIEAAGAGDIVVVDNRGRCDTGGWGGLLSLAASVKGLAGAVVDGACRDVDEASDLGFPLFARAGVTRTARGRVIEDATNVQIEFCGVVVRPGDLVIADWTGVVIVAADRAEEVLATAEDIAARETRMAEAVRAGRPIAEVMGASYEQMLEKGSSGNEA